MNITIRTNHPKPTRKLIENIADFRGRYGNAVSIFHIIQSDDETIVGVAGDGDNGTYEWFVDRPTGFVMSDVGYGDSRIALFYGLKQILER